MLFLKKMSFTNFFIWKPGSVMWFICAFLAVALMIILTYSLRDKKQNEKDIYVLFLSLFNAIFFLWYRGIEWIMSDSIQGYEFNIWNELPLHLCNLNIILMPIAIVVKKKFLFCYVFFTASLGSFFALIAPFPPFSNCPIYIPTTFGFVWTHFNLMIISVLYITLGYYKPRLRDSYKIILTFVVVSVSIHLINLLFNKLVYPTNFFYTMGTENIGLLDVFYKLIPYRFFYLIFGLLILTVFVFMFTLSYSVFLSLSKTRKQVKEDAYYKVLNHHSRFIIFTNQFREEFVKILAEA